jgi:hypothetical protein
VWLFFSLFFFFFLEKWVGSGATDNDGNALDLTAVKKLVSNADYRGKTFYLQC